MITLFFFCIVLGGASVLKAQHEDKKPALSGIVVDAYTLDPLPYAHITKNHRQGEATDENGRFTIEINPRDTIEVTYVGYQTLALSSQQKEANYVIVPLTPSVSLLQEVEVHFMPAEEAFKFRFFSLGRTKYDIYAQHNITLIKLFADAIPAPEDAPFLSHPYIGAPPSFIFFSSRGQRGVTRLIRSASLIDGQRTYFKLKPERETNKNLMEALNITSQAASVGTDQHDSIISKKKFK